MRPCQLFLKLVIAGTVLGYSCAIPRTVFAQIGSVPVTRKAMQSYLPRSAPAARSGFSPPHSTIASIHTPIRSDLVVPSTGTNPRRPE